MYKVYDNGNGKYSVKKDGSKRASKIFDNKNDAYDYCDKKNKELGIESSAKNNFIFRKIIIGVLSTFIVVIVAILGLKFGIFDASNLSSSSSNNTSSIVVNEGVHNEFQIHFLELGNKYSGDSIYIKAGENDILIDAGSLKGSAKYIKEYVDQYCIDGKLEYVIATHADKDHISGFVGNSSNGIRDGILYQYEVGTLIDFALTEKTHEIYKEYLEAREMLKANGTNVYTAAQAFNETDGAKRIYELGEGMQFQILYNKYYFELSKDENNHSVVTLFSYTKNGVKNDYLLTGDLEVEGEEAMVEYYKENPGILGHVVLFKAGHHGSKTSSNDVLLELITPEISVVTCCAWAQFTDKNANTFPTQQYIDRISKYTDQVYVTSVYDEENDDLGSLNGTVIISSNGEEVSMYGSNNTTKLKDTEWFSETVYVDSTGKLVTKDTAGAIAIPRRTMPAAWK